MTKSRKVLQNGAEDPYYLQLSLAKEIVSIILSTINSHYANVSPESVMKYNWGYTTKIPQNLIKTSKSLSISRWLRLSAKNQTKYFSPQPNFSMQ